MDLCKWFTYNTIMNSAEIEKFGGVDGDAFKLLMRQQASTVAIITTGGADAGPGGLTATAVMSLTATPASVAVCVNKSASAHDLIIETGKFGVNFLGADQVEASNVFSNNALKDERFEHVDWFVSESGVALLRGTAASAACSVEHSVPVFSHTLFLGVVHEVFTGDASPLIYGDGRYGKFERI